MKLNETKLNEIIHGSLKNVLKEYTDNNPLDNLYIVLDELEALMRQNKSYQLDLSLAYNNLKNAILMLEKE